MSTPARLVLYVGLQLLLFQLSPVQDEVYLAFQGREPLEPFSPNELRDGQAIASVFVLAFVVSISSLIRPSSSLRVVRIYNPFLSCPEQMPFRDAVNPS